MTFEYVRPEWTPSQVASLNAFQAMAKVHPFTCLDRGSRATPHGTWHGFDTGVLLATEGGWVCLDCDYRQNWAHSFMADWSWRTNLSPGMARAILMHAKVAQR